MWKFIFRLSFFFFLAYLIGEGVVRVLKVNIDVPKFYQDTDGLIKFKPNQTGNYVNGRHKWKINRYGYFGYEPNSLDSVITIIGDSFISNVLNPPECHQAQYLSDLNSNFNFFPASRDGAGFLEFMEISKSIDSLNPIKHLLYVHHGDFIESINEIRPNSNTVQVLLKEEKIKYPILQSSPIKDFLYNFKLAYFLYRNYLLKDKNIQTNNRDEKFESIDYDSIQLLLDFTKKNYDTKRIVLVFSPDSDKKVVELLMKNNFETFVLETNNYKSWQMENDSHWSCFGHKEVAKQVNKYLESLVSSNSLF